MRRWLNSNVQVSTSFPSFLSNKSKKEILDKKMDKKKIIVDLEFSGRCFDDGDESAAAQFPKLRRKIQGLLRENANRSRQSRFTVDSTASCLHKRPENPYYFHPWGN